MCFGAREDVEAKRSREIDAMIHRDEKVMQRQVKLLLLGTPLSPPALDQHQINKRHWARG